jgi:hypothetical protein
MENAVEASTLREWEKECLEPAGRRSRFSRLRYRRHRIKQFREPRASPAGP